MIHCLWPTYIGEFYNHHHESIKSELIDFFDQYRLENPNSKPSTENHKLYESQYNLHKLNHPVINQLFQFFSHCFYQIFQAEQNKDLFPENFLVQIIESWFITYDDGGFVAPHTHSNHPVPTWSCVYYVQAEDAEGLDGRTHFQRPNTSGHEFQHIAPFKCQEGLLIVWPSSLVHGSYPHYGESNKIIVSANAMISEKS